MTENCPICGTTLVITNWGYLWCPNHGKIFEEKEEDPEKERGYIG
jgi:uncharacterized Zn finger protein (UPF0148 family)